MTSWRTTIGGIIVLLIPILDALKLLFDGDPATNPNWNLLVPQLAAGIALIHARDNKVTSEQAGAGQTGNVPKPTT